MKRVLRFLRQISIPVRNEPGARGFLDHVQIRNGEIFADLDKVAISDVLHEAGHIAIVPRAYRSLLNDDVESGLQMIFDHVLSLGLGPDHPLRRAVMQTGDAEATAWAWAAGKHLRIAEERIIEDDQYEGNGSSVRAFHSMGWSLGIHGLQHAGFCSVRPNGRGDAVYPRLNFWTQEAPA